MCNSYEIKTFIRRLQFDLRLSKAKNYQQQVQLKEGLNYKADF